MRREYALGGAVAGFVIGSLVARRARSQIGYAITASVATRAATWFGVRSRVAVASPTAMHGAARLAFLVWPAIGAVLGGAHRI